jgi:hypothetical protein
MRDSPDACKLLKTWKPMCRHLIVVESGRNASVKLIFGFKCIVTIVNVKLVYGSYRYGIQQQGIRGAFPKERRCMTWSAMSERLLFNYIYQTPIHRTGILSLQRSRKARAVGVLLRCRLMTAMPTWRISSVMSTLPEWAAQSAGCWKGRKPNGDRRCWGR